ncbi:2-dehydropantoate 2-reductase [Rhodoplanes elegans]|uniref:2-dehydropantoate 2-reductase n=1 Tax=Rhodoplanes elegans TaxID=29408 RepID=A0A327KE11_9BRAD|nr:2-dehydropantoate 2-reductase [Rhodoplanes elegans]RAI36980.1 2-dehydropantoate 2-reductase [Rhodoplanes elegans]
MREEAVRVAVIGGGAIGGLLSAHLCDAGHDVTLCVRTPFEALVVERGGCGDTVPVRIATSPDDVAPVPWVLVAVKSQDTAAAGPWLRGLVGDATTVVVVQNGIGHAERVAPFVGAATVLPALIYSGVERLAPGHIRLHTEGRITVPEGAPGSAFAALMRTSGLAVHQELDFVTAVWRKVLTNVAANPITALTLRRIGIFQDADVAAFGETLIAEAVAVGQAEGAKIGAADVAHTLHLHKTYNPATGTSMLYDRLAGRPMEHEFITGAVVRTAERHGLAVPFNRAILTLLRALAGGAAAERSTIDPSS